MTEQFQYGSSRRIKGSPVDAWAGGDRFGKADVGDSVRISHSREFDKRRAPGLSFRDQDEQQICMHLKVSFELSARLVAAASDFADRSGVSVPSVFLAAFAVLLSRYRNREEVWVALCQPGAHPYPTSALAVECASTAAFVNIIEHLSHALPGQQSGGSVLDGAQVPEANQIPQFCDVCFLWQEGATEAALDRNVRSSGLDLGTASQFGLILSLRPSTDRIAASLWYHPEMFETATVRGLTHHFEKLSRSLITRPGIPVGQFDVTSEEERGLILGRYSGTTGKLFDTSIHAAFAECVARNPEAEALVFGTDRSTYRQLDRRSNQIARLLEAEGVRPGDHIGILMEPSRIMIAAMLGILKAGAAYVPIDPQYPAERQNFIVCDSSVRWILTDKDDLAVRRDSISVLNISSAACLDTHSADPISLASDPEAVALIIYTSGSTGEPKGACIPHRAVMRTVRDTDYVEFTAKDRVAQVASPSFDASIMEVWGALANGGTLVGMRRETLLSPTALKQLVEQERLSVLVLNTAFMHHIGNHAPWAVKGVRKIVFGGEAAEPGPLRKVLDEVGPGVLVNGYGPSEACVISTYYGIDHIPEGARSIPIGPPVAHTRVFLLDQQMRLVPIGALGEIYIGGEGVARGYWNRPELTAHRFVKDPFSSTPGRLLYRTGDFARLREDGNLEFQGRLDEQVKIRGHRIELAEVRQAIAAHENIKEVFVTVRENAPGDRRLIAYVSLRQSTKTRPEVLRAFANSKLPPHMVPASFVILDALPLNTNGKVDRAALPAPNGSGWTSEAGDEREDGIEGTLKQLWRELLKVRTVASDDNFFDLGGDSLLAACMIAHLEKQTGHDIPITTLLEAPTVSQLASKLSDRTYSNRPAGVVQFRRAVIHDVTAKPLFAVQWQSANLVTFHKIASLLSGDRAVYGIEPPDTDEMDKLPTVEAVATYCVERIIRTQPTGPYLLSGICIGGILAYEVAQQLQASGREVELLMLIDSDCPGPLQLLHERSALTRYVDDHIGEILMLNGTQLLRYSARCISNGLQRVRVAIGFHGSTTPPKDTRHRAVQNARKALAYRPKPYAGKVTHLLSSDGPHRSYEDRRLAWSSLAEGGHEIHIVPGDHINTFEEPYVRVVSERFQSCIDRIKIGRPSAANEVNRYLVSAHHAGD